MVDLRHVREVLKRITYTGFELRAEDYLGGAPYLQLDCLEGIDNETGLPKSWRGRKWILSYHMTDGEIVQTAFLAITQALEHEAREKFKYRGVSVFDPHYDIDALVIFRTCPDSIKVRDEFPPCTPLTRTTSRFENQAQSTHVRDLWRRRRTSVHRLA